MWLPPGQERRLCWKARAEPVRGGACAAGNALRLLPAAALANGNTNRSLPGGFLEDKTQPREAPAATANTANTAASRRAGAETPRSLPGTLCPAGSILQRRTHTVPSPDSPYGSHTARSAPRAAPRAGILWAPAIPSSDRADFIPSLNAQSGRYPAALRSTSPRIFILRTAYFHTAHCVFSRLQITQHVISEFQITRLVFSYYAMRIFVSSNYAERIFRLRGAYFHTTQ